MSAPTQEIHRAPIKARVCFIFMSAIPSLLHNAHNIYNNYRMDNIPYLT